jgi:hypothetical protein
MVAFQRVAMAILLTKNYSLMGNPVITYKRTPFYVFSQKETITILSVLLSESGD